MNKYAKQIEVLMETSSLLDYNGSTRHTITLKKTRNELNKEEDNMLRKHYEGNKLIQKTHEQGTCQQIIIRRHTLGGKTKKKKRTHIK